MNNNLQLLLEKAGFNHYESKTYLYLLTAGELPASKIAQHLKLPRTTVRNTLDKLCEQGVISKLYKRTTQYYRCKSPETLIGRLEEEITKTQEKISEIQQALPLFASLFTQKDIVPKVQYFQGIQQVIEAFNSTLYVEDLQEILVLTSYDFLTDSRLRKNDDEFYIPMRVHKGIYLRSIVGNPKVADKGSIKEPHELRERRFFPKEYSFPGTFYIYGNFVLYFSAGNKEYIAVIIESKDMAETMRTLHQFMWEQCSNLSVSN